MEPQGLEPRVSEVEALRKLARPGLFGLLRRERRLRAEWVSLPVWLFRAALETGRGRVEFVVAVDGTDAEVRRLDGSVELERSERRGAAEFLPRIGPDEACERLRAELPTLTLSWARHARGLQAEPSIQRLGLWGWPVLVQHLRQGRRRSVRAVDGVCGALLGARGRARLVTAFVEARRRARDGDGSGLTPR